jgi:hypothetical protein
LVVDDIDYNGASFSAASGHPKDNTCFFSNIDFSNISDATKIYPRQTGEVPRIFLACVGMHNVVIPEGVTHDYNNFQACSVINLVYPSTIQKVNLDNYRRDRNTYDAVAGGAIIIKAVQPPIGWANFGNYPIMPQYIYVPDNSINAYHDSAVNFSGADLKPISEFISDNS